MKVKITNIKWCVEEEDVCDIVYEMGVEEGEDDYYEEVDRQIENIINGLPTTVEYDFDDEYTPEEIDDHIDDILSDDFGWLTYGFNYEIIED